MKILPIDHRRDGEPKISEFFTPLPLLIVVGGAKSNVMDGSGGYISQRPARLLNHVELPTGRLLVEGKSASIFLLSDYFEPEHTC